MNDLEQRVIELEKQVETLATSVLKLTLMIEEHYKTLSKILDNLDV